MEIDGKKTIIYDGKGEVKRRIVYTPQGEYVRINVEAIDENGGVTKEEIVYVLSKYLKKSQINNTDKNKNKKSNKDNGSTVNNGGNENNDTGNQTTDGGGSEDNSGDNGGNTRPGDGGGSGIGTGGIFNPIPD